MGIVAGFMWLAMKAVPLASFALPARHATSLGLAVAGVGTAIAGVISFRIAKTTVNPLKPETVSSLVVTGIYWLTRNPMYLGMLIVLIGWAAFLANIVAVALTLSFVFYLNRFQIIPEEKALTTRFGREFEAYRANVRRWL
jgi:protein-S-isoprenylcysteine O-methyltransferase Ste14